MHEGVGGWLAILCCLSVRGGKRAGQHRWRTKVREKKRERATERDRVKQRGPIRYKGDEEPREVEAREVETGQGELRSSVQCY